jgi:hypothetical protein
LIHVDTAAFVRWGHPVINANVKNPIPGLSVPIRVKIVMSVAMGRVWNQKIHIPVIANLGGRATNAMIFSVKQTLV